MTVVSWKIITKKHVSDSVANPEIRLDTEQLLKLIPNLGLIIDLTYTDRYYNPQVFRNKGIGHVKIVVPGHTVPSRKYSDLFNEHVNTFLSDNANNDKLIGVHCTHGINRTGFMICNYMIKELSIPAETAMQRFAEGRGHAMERANYIDHFKKL